MSTTPNLGITEVSASQNNKTVTLATGMEDLDNAIAGQTTKDCSAGGTITLSRAEWLSMVLKLTGTPAAGFNLVVPVGPKVYIVDNQSGQTATVKTTSGTGVACSTGTISILRADGTNVIAVNAAIGTGGTNPYDMAFPFPTPAASQVSELVVVRPITLKAGLANSKAFARTAATASTVFTIQKNGSNLTGGTITFASSGTTATFALTSDTTFAAGDRLAVVAPASPDATLAGVCITIAGLRN